MPRLQFTCPKCGSHTLEEIMVNVTVCSEIATIDIEDGEIELAYEDQTNEDGEVDRYQCGDCGETISQGRIDLTEDNPAFAPITVEET